MNKQMAIRNRIKSLVDARGDTRYKFWKRTGVSQNTAYNLYNDPTQIPVAEVMNRICDAYGVQPGDFLIHVPDEKIAS